MALELECASARDFVGFGCGAWSIAGPPIIGRGRLPRTAPGRDRHFGEAFAYRRLAVGRFDASAQNPTFSDEFGGSGLPPCAGPGRPGVEITARLITPILGSHDSDPAAHVRASSMISKPQLGPQIGFGGKGRPLPCKHSDLPTARHRSVHLSRGCAAADQ